MQFTPTSLLFPGKVLAEPLCQCIFPYLHLHSTFDLGLKTHDCKKFRTFYHWITLLYTSPSAFALKVQESLSLAPHQNRLCWFVLIQKNELCLFSKTTTLHETYFLVMFCAAKLAFSCVCCRLNLNEGLDKVGCLGGSY